MKGKSIKEIGNINLDAKVYFDEKNQVVQIISTVGGDEIGFAVKTYDEFIDMFD